VMQGRDRRYHTLGRGTAAWILAASPPSASTHRIQTGISVMKSIALPTAARWASRAEKELKERKQSWRGLCP